MKSRTSLLNNVLGAFADGAILFPLMALLTLKAGFSGSMILFTTGIAYLISSLFFQVPMSVQPLKSIAVAAVTVGATFSEVRLSGMLLGLFCIVLLFFNVDRIAKKVPTSVIHQLQLGLGILLILQGFTHGVELGVLATAFFMVMFPSIAGIPLLGLAATIGLLLAVFSKHPIVSPALTQSIFSFDSDLKMSVVAGLLLPQLALTLANSVLATKDVAQRSFGDRAKRVNIRNLLCSIGFGNVIVALSGGMPFCHGSGGITAHVKGGSTQAWSTGLMGMILLILSGVQFFQGTSLLNYPASLASILLVTTGIFHIQLAKPTGIEFKGRIKLIVAASLTVATRNLIAVLFAALLMELIFSLFPKEGKIHDQLS